MEPVPAVERSSERDGRASWLLAIDTATSDIVIAAGLPSGEPLGLSTWSAGYRHGETLLPAIGRLTGENNLRRSRIRGVIVGTGPGTFTGLRVGIATAKGIARGLAIPIVGVSTAVGLVEAYAREQGLKTTADLALLLPAGPQDRLLIQNGTATVLPAGTEPDLPAGTTLVAIDLPDRAPADALARGAGAKRGLGAELLRQGGIRLAAHDTDDISRLVPEYVTRPRGVMGETGEVTITSDVERRSEPREAAWSPDRP
jgi:tRNA threonylcarbamoyl adenosine modification protein YeaZ